MKVYFINHPTIELLKNVIEYVNRNVSSGKFPKIATNELLTLNYAELWFQKFKLGKQLYSVAVIDDEIVGVSHIDIFHGRRNHGGKLAITVDAEFRNKGIGSVLLENIIEQCRVNGILLIRAEPTEDNKHMIHLLNKYGFKVDGRFRKAFHDDSGEYLDLIEYTLELQGENYGQ
jgi:L-amino acid N-acyltransferase YncA